MTPFNSYEISPCQRLDDAGLPDPNGKIFEICEPDEAHCWTLYGHIPGEGTMAIGDFESREDAEEVFQRITGIPFGSQDEVQARLRVMRAGERLLKASQEALCQFEHNGDEAPEDKEVLDQLQAAIAEATEQRSSMTTPQPFSLREALEHVRSTLKLRHIDEATDEDVEEALKIAVEALAGSRE